MDNPIKNDNGLTDAVYDLAIEPDRFGEFIEIWEQYMLEQGLLNHKNPKIERALVQHFERAFEVMQRAEFTAKPKTEQLPQRSVASMTVSLQGNIESFNDLASPIADTHTHLNTLLCPESIEPVLACIADVARSNKAKPLLINLQSGTPCLFLMRTSPTDDKIIIDANKMSWHTAHKEQLTSLYRLTPRECDIAGLLFQGLSIKEIASQQHRSTETVRKQTKALLSKTDTHSQAQLMRLLASINLSSGLTPPSRWQHSYLDNKIFDLDDNRKVSYYTSGKPTTGTAVVMHGILHDHELPIDVHDALLGQGYQVVGLARAWFGDSSPPSKKQHLLSVAANDLNQLLGFLNIERVTLIGLMAGSLHAYKFSSLFPNKVDQIINISGVIPITDDAQLQHLPRGIRSIARSARYFPKTLPALVLAGVSLLMRGNIRRLFEIGYRNSPPDLEATLNPRIMKRLSKGFRFAVQHGYAAYTYEGIEIMRKMEKELANTICPVHYINGAQDGLTSIDSVISFCNSMNNTTVTAIAGAGNLLIYTAPEVVASELCQALASASKNNNEKA